MNIAKHQQMSLVVFLILAGSTCPGFAQTGVDLDVSWDIEQLLRTEDLSIDGVRILTQGILLEVYERNGFSPIWTDRGSVRVGGLEGLA